MSTATAEKTEEQATAGAAGDLDAWAVAMVATWPSLTDEMKRELGALLSVPSNA